MWWPLDRCRQKRQSRHVLVKEWCSHTRRTFLYSVSCTARIRTQLRQAWCNLYPIGATWPLARRESGEFGVVTLMPTLYRSNGFLSTPSLTCFGNERSFHASVLALRSDLRLDIARPYALGISPLPGSFQER